MLLDTNKLPHEQRNFVHRRLIGAVGGFLTGGPTGAVSGFVRGGGNGAPQPPSSYPTYGPPLPQAMATIPTTPTMASGQPPCVLPWRRDPLTGECKIFLGVQSGPDPGPGTAVSRPRGQRAQFVGYAHHPHEPMREAVTVRRCTRGHVLSWEGLCVSKRDIRNSDRMYPKPPKPLGTRAQLKAVRVASSFGRALKTNDKRLRKLAKDLNRSR